MEYRTLIWGLLPSSPMSKILPWILACTPFLLANSPEAQCLTAEFRADETATASQYAGDLAVLGDELVVGSYGELGDRTPEAAVFILEREGSNWFARERLELESFTNSLRMGLRVAAGPAGIAITAPVHEQHLIGCFIFEEQPDSSWKRTRLFNDADRTSYPADLVVGEDFVAVGFPRDDGNGRDTGSVHLFGEKDGIWTVTGELAPALTEGSLHFGQNLAYANGILAISATGDDENGEGSGAVYLFEHTGGRTWNRLRKLMASDGHQGDFFGASLAFDGTTLVVGATGVDYGRWDAGGVYIFEKRFGEWTEIQRLALSNPEPNRHLGRSVAVRGDRLLVGSAEREPSIVRVYKRSPVDGLWDPNGSLATNPDHLGGDMPFWRQQFGDSLALLGTRAFVSSSLKNHGFQLEGSGFEYSLDASDCASLENHTLLSTGSAEFTIARGPAGAGKPYILLGSHTGTSPGLPLGTDRVPLNYDFYFLATLSTPTKALLRGSLGILDANGQATIQLDVPTEYVASLGNIKLHHAFLELSGGSVTHISNAVGTWMWPQSIW